MDPILKEKKYTLLDLLTLPFRCSPGASAVLLSLALLAAVVPTLQIVATAGFIDSAMAVASGKQPMGSVYLPILWVVLCITFSWMNAEVSKFAKSKQLLRIKEKYRTAITTHRAALAYRHIENHETWDLIQRVSKDAENALAQGFNILLSFADMILRTVGILLLIITQVWWAALVILAVSIPLLYLSVKAGRAQYGVSREVAKYERRYEYLSDVLRGRENVEERALFGYEKMLNERFSENFDSAFQRWYKMQRKWFIRMKSGSILTACLSLAIAGILIGPTIGRSLSIGLFVSLVNAIIAMVHMMSWQLTYIADEITKKTEYMKDLTAFMELQTVEGSLNTPAIVTPVFESVVFDNVTFKYPGTDTLILDRFSLRMERGRHYAFVGANGAGKTTVTKLLTGLYPEYEGAIRLNGKELREYRQEELISFYSVLYQDFAKYFTTVRNNVAIGDVNRMDDGLILDTLQAIHMEDAVDKLPGRLDTPLGKIDKEGQDLSGGQWQRLAMARAIYSPAPFRILDEPTASLDPVSESRLYEEYERISRNKTTLFISHRLGSTKLADHIFVIEGGAVTEQGTHTDLMALQGFYARMYDTQREWYQ